MKLPKGVLYIVLAVVAGLVATVSIHRYVTTKTRVVKKPTARVLVASAEISPGTALTPSHVKNVTWPKELVPQGAPATFDAVKDRVVIMPLNRGEPILMNKLAPEGTAAGLGGLLSDGKRAMTVRVDDVSGVAGFVKPGDHVDVLMSIAVPNQSEEQYSKVILQNIVVLSTGQIWEQQQQDQKPVVVNTVTLEVAPDQGETLNLASHQGKIRLALRSRNNLETASTGGVVTSQLVNLPRPQVASVPMTTSKPGRGIEVIKGMERTKSSI